MAVALVGDYKDDQGRGVGYFSSLGMMGTRYMGRRGDCIWWTKILILYWWTLVGNPIGSHESLSLKLSGIWLPLDSSDIVGAYKASQVARRKEGWNLLKRLSQVSVRPWLCAGDYNEILEQHEKEGALPRVYQQIWKFRECLQDSRLQDLDFKGNIFTLCNHSEDPHTFRTCLD
ncbi:UNVERIFIED_CONTAM: hypothetical protein Sradi_0199900 [Sesamum radiatum]|uniref:Reverse transcriptase n=1 Tax=Sesamum radiatum TaxID=300843 RepID=A0AAW2VZE0_SESRA